MIYSFSPFGYEGSMVNVEVDLRRGIPAIDIVGISDACVAETRNRVRSAIQNQKLEFPSERVLISLSPADLKKEGALFDLPIALAILEAQYGLDSKDCLFSMGELELSGNVREVRAVNAGLQNAFWNGVGYAIVPYSDDLVIPKGMKVKTVRNLTEAYFAMCDIVKDDYSDFKGADAKGSTEFKIEFTDVNDDESLDEIPEHNGLKFAMAVAAAGKHSILAVGTAGCGKTMVLQRMPQLMPKLTEEEKSTVTRIYSIAGLDGLPRNNERPFRMPHQTASIEGICGGGTQCRPGEISLAHNGVLFLDEGQEFRCSVLQMLRVPLETKNITLSRAGRSTVYPANFQLAMSVLPCPCGNYGVPNRICLCSRHSIEQYWKKFSGPLLDRFAIRFNCVTENNIEYSEWTLEALRRKVKIAWERQHERQGKLNDELDTSEIAKYVKLTTDAEKTLEEITAKLDLSTRCVANILRMARTIADMNDIVSTELLERVDKKDLLTAIALNKLPLDL